MLSAPAAEAIRHAGQYFASDSSAITITPSTREVRKFFRPTCIFATYSSALSRVTTKDASGR